jgi:uncharacterized membrane protein YhaH (DUF805 family)
MSAVNPYAPPLAAVADVTDRRNEVQPVKTWSAQGRVGRMRYVANMIGAYVLMVAGGLLSGLLTGLQMDLLGKVVLWASIIGYVIFVLLKTIQRSHDMDWSGWFSLLAFIPFVGLIWVFKRGTDGLNSFGAPAPANTLGVKILVFALPGIAIVGIIAAIALPAYQMAAKRAATTTLPR